MVVLYFPQNTEYKRQIAEFEEYAPIHVQAILSNFFTQGVFSGHHIDRHSRLDLDWALFKFKIIKYLKNKWFFSCKQT